MDLDVYFVGSENKELEALFSGFRVFYAQPHHTAIVSTNYNLVIRTDCRTQLTSDQIKQLIQEVIELPYWDVFYFTKWADRCDLYTNNFNFRSIGHTYLQTFSPNGYQAILFRPTCLNIKNFDPIRFNDNFGLYLNRLIHDGLLRAYCTIPNIFEPTSDSSNIPLCRPTPNDFVQRMRTSTNEDFGRQSSCWNYNGCCGDIGMNGLINGINGMDLSQGVSGMNGVNNTNGTNGTSPINGSTGSAGVTGSTGSAGPFVTVVIPPRPGVTPLLIYIGILVALVFLAWALYTLAPKPLVKRKLE